METYIGLKRSYIYKFAEYLKDIKIKYKIVNVKKKKKKNWLLYTNENQS